MPLPRNLHLHLDPVGGIAGDMFLAAAVDLRPELAEGALAAMRAAGLPESCRPAFSQAHDHGFQGRRFAVAEPPAGKDPRYPAIRAALDDSTLLPGIKRRALEIYRLLAEAEAEIHGTGIEEVHFHELAAWDTLADVVGAAFVIDSFAAVGWSVAPLPLGSGQVKTAHGLLPVPAPATAKLLEGFQVLDDGQPGERVTPTGAAILRHLSPAQRKPETPMRLCDQGFGFGTRQLADRPNCLRLLALAPLDGAVEAAALAEEEIAVVTFEVDDQTPEDLAIGLDNLRALEGVLDVVHAPVFGKKNRMAVHVRLLCRPESLEAAIAGCFSETTTIGLRWQKVGRVTLERTHYPGELAVKVVRRPGGLQTAKAEADGLAPVSGGHAARRAAARTAERKALSGTLDPEET